MLHLQIETHSAKDCGDAVVDSNEELRQKLKSLRLEHDAETLC